MPQDITRRFLLAVATLIGVLWLIFFMMWIIPGDVAMPSWGTAPTQIPWRLSASI
jgi:ABC-type dipeptide/oligopeptide/nickel transport system permease component